jgi:hypothetical protein
MGKVTHPRYHVELDFAQLDDQDRHDLVAGISQAAKTSALTQGSPLMQASLAALLQKDADLAVSNGTVTSDRQKLKADAAAEVVCRSELDLEIRSYAALAERGAKSPADLTGVGFTPRPPKVSKTLAPEVPASLDVAFPKKGHGKAKVSVHETGKSRGSYVAEQCFEPAGAGPWTPLGVGTGKVRWVSGASGTKVWVRFATVRGQLQSAWCTPVLITLP